MVPSFICPAALIRPAKETKKSDAVEVIAVPRAPSPISPLKTEAAHEGLKGSPIMTTKKPRSANARRKHTIAFDGACHGNPGPGGYAGICVDEKTGEEKIVRGGDPATTNNRMELTAAIEALNAVRPGASVTMIGDSQYVLKGITEWLPGWKARGWRTAQRKPVLNAELWQALEAAVERMPTFAGRGSGPQRARAQRSGRQDRERRSEAGAAIKQRVIRDTAALDLQPVITPALSSGT